MNKEGTAVSRPRASATGKSALISLVRLLPLSMRQAIVADYNLRGKKSAPPLVSPKRTFVGSFHKTGTALLSKTFHSLCAVSGARFWNRSADRTEPETWHICFAWDSDFNGVDGFEDESSRALVVIRDPRDVIVSAAHYHLDSNEPWLHKPRPDFGGQSYQEEIRAKPNMRARYLFEIENSSGNTIERMRRTKQDPRFKSALFVHFEDLVEDTKLECFWKIFAHLDIDAYWRPSALQAAYNNSLFAVEPRRDSHVRDGSVSQWKRVFDDELIGLCEARFGDAIEVLGYPRFRR